MCVCYTHLINTQTVREVGTIQTLTYSWKRPWYAVTTRQSSPCTGCRIEILQWTVLNFIILWIDSLCWASILTFCWLMKIWRDSTLINVTQIKCIVMAIEHLNRYTSIVSLTPNFLCLHETQMKGCVIAGVGHKAYSPSSAIQTCIASVRMKKTGSHSIPPNVQVIGEKRCPQECCWCLLLQRDALQACNGFIILPKPLS